MPAGVFVSLLANICVLYHFFCEKSTEIENKLRDLTLRIAYIEWRVAFRMEERTRDFGPFDSAQDEG